MTMHLLSCTPVNKEMTDKFNDMAYDFHYRNLDSTLYYADKALNMAGRYDGGRAEAYNNKAFVSIAKMQYDLAERQLDSILHITDNQVELLVMDIQQMRLCQRQSKNKDFYTFRESALRRMKRIQEEESSLDSHLLKRMIYARSELNIVTSTYYYYVGLDQQSAEALLEIDPYGEVLKDTAQLLNYLYNVGAGGVIIEGTQEEINQEEMECLIRCYNIAEEASYIFWVANSMQAMSEHLQVPVLGQLLIDDNYNALKYINVENMPDSLLAGNLAQRSLDLFIKYGDVYQTAGSYRTLAQCYWYIGDDEAALGCLNDALANDSAIFRAPDLVASIREQLSVAYAGINDKENSHLNRNLYLDTQDKTRQDLYLESRAEQLNKSVKLLNGMITAIVALMGLAFAMLFFFQYLRRRDAKRNSVDKLLLPLEEWKKDNEQHVAQLEEKYDETMENMAVSNLHIDNSKRLYLEQRTKVSLANMVMPYIDRILHEINKLSNAEEDETTRKERYDYLTELTERIMEYNEILTQWIQLRKGELSLHIESFPIQALFDIVGHGRTGFQLKNINLDILPTQLWVKADRVLTLFMINTLADNARKFTQEGGNVTIQADEYDDYVEISVKDTGIGMTPQQVQDAFSVEKKIITQDKGRMDGANEKGRQVESGHGFGLVNCKGIIEKYKKISSLFNVCHIGVESEKDKGSRFFFSLPKGAVRGAVSMFLALFVSVGTMGAAEKDDLLLKAKNYTDSLYQCNINDNNDAALGYAEKALGCLNKAYGMMVAQGKDTLVLLSDKSVLQAEILWYHDHLPFDYDVILKLRNEVSVAALALHEWAIYRYNNKVYTQLYKELSADSTLEDYCRTMQKSESNKYMAIVILIILLLLILLAYFMLYYRHQVYYRFCLERVRNMNDVLRGKMDDKQKLEEIEKLAGYGDGRQLSKIAQGRRQIYDREKLPQELQKIADQLITTLKKSISVNNQIIADIDLAEDEVRKSQLENDKLHVCNSVLDNCLSTLKHETMYYPSRIRTLLGDGDAQLQSIAELAHYYKEIYAILSMQSMRQVESIKNECRPVEIEQVLPVLKNHPLAKTRILGDKQMLNYLFEILRKKGNAQTVIDVRHEDAKYVVLRFSYDNLKLDEEQCHELFNPHINNLPFLLCRQIIRDVGENTNARRCGIMAEVNASGGTDIIVTLVKAQRQNTNVVMAEENLETNH